MVTTIVRILVAATLACLAAGFVFELVDANRADAPLSLARIVDHAVAFAPWTLPFGAAFIVLTEWLGLRHWLAYLAGGIAIVFAAGLLASEGAVPRFTELVLAPGVLQLTVMGCVSGLVYWLAHGRWAGWAGDAAEAVAATSRQQWVKTLDAQVPPRCWPCLLGGLALAALPLLALGALKIAKPDLCMLQPSQRLNRQRS